MKRPSLISRFALSTAALAAVVVLLAMLFLMITEGPFYEGTVTTRLRGFSMTMADIIWEDASLASKVARRHRVGVVVVTPDSTVAYDNEGQPVEARALLDRGFRYRRIDVTRDHQDAIIFSWDMVDFAHEHVVGVTVLVLLLLLTIAVTYAFQLTQLRPLRGLLRGVRAVAAGDFETRVEVVRRDEIGEVADAFNQMTGRVHGMIEARERLLADVSHELRSPLSRIKVALEFMPEGEKRDGIARDVDEIEALVAVLLERERLRFLGERDELELVELQPILREMVQLLEARPPGIDLQIPGSPLRLRADRQLLRLLLHNLIDNALKFSTHHSAPVQIRVAQEGGSIALRVLDDGIGVEEQQLERIFDPFVKGDPARGHGVGHGLGLDLCRRIAQAHGATIVAARRAPRGLELRVDFPSD